MYRLRSRWLAPGSRTLGRQARSLGRGAARRVFPGGKTRWTVESVAFAPDKGVMAACANSTIRSCGTLPAGKERSGLLEHRAPVGQIGFSPDGRILASSDTDGYVILWDWSIGRRLACLCPERAPQNSSCSRWLSRRTARHLRSRTRAREIDLYDVATGKRTAAVGDGTRRIIEMSLFSRQENPRSRPKAIGWSSAGTWILMSTVPFTAKPKVQRVLCAVSPDGRQLVTGDTSGSALQPLEPGCRVIRPPAPRSRADVPGQPVARPDALRRSARRAVRGSSSEVPCNRANRANGASHLLTCRETMSNEAPPRTDEM